MFKPWPIVEGDNGVLDILFRSADSPGRCRAASEDEFYKDAEYLERVYRALSNMTHEVDQYRCGRAANNLTAVYICTERRPDAWDAIHRADEKFRGLLDEGALIWRLAWSGIAVSRYNAAVLYREWWDKDHRLETAENFIVGALDALDQVEKDDPFTGASFVPDGRHKFLRSTVEEFWPFPQ